MDDLLLSRHWEVCVVDPLAVEYMKDKTWTCEIFADPSLSGEPVTRRPKGSLVVVQVFHAPTLVATLLLPPTEKGGDAAVGYASYRIRDGRPLLRSMLPRAENEDDLSKKGGGVLEQEAAQLEFAEPPEGDVLEGPFFAVPREGTENIAVSVGQDIGSEHWARLPRGYRVQAFAEIMGLRARLPDLEGGGWVNLVDPDGTPLFRKEPAPYIAPSGPEEENEDGQHVLPVVWPFFGVLRPPKHASEVVEKASEAQLPSLLKRLGGGRVLCDWQRMKLPPFDVFVWKSPLTYAQTTLDSLLKERLWKASVVEAHDGLRIREHGDPRSKCIATRPWGSLVVSEWVAPGNAVRLLVPHEADDPKPAHAWADLGGADGASLVPLAPGSLFWVEPRGGHLPEEEQEDPPEMDPASLPVREGEDPKSAEVGHFWRGDIVQIAEMDGCHARVLLTGMSVFRANAPDSGWIDIFDEAGWSILKAKHPGEVHAEELRRRHLEEFAEDEPPQRAYSVLSPDVAELPALLWQLAELEQNSICTRDWREAVDPIWGHRYFINKWSGQIVRKLESMGVACATVRLTMWWSNMSIDAIHAHHKTEDDAHERLDELKTGLIHALSALADVPEDTTEVFFEEGPYEGPGRADSGAGAKTARSNSTEDSIMGGTGGRRATAKEDEDLSRFRIVALFRAPGVRASWASAALQECASTI
jgi:hypothetical protein